MTIGANLNGGSLTIGGTSINIGNLNSVINISSGTINASNFKMYSTSDATTKSFWIDTIQSNLNTQLVIGFYNASEVYLGNSKNKVLQIGGDAGFVNIANTGLSATSKILIGSAVNATGSEMFLGSPTLSRMYIRGGDVNINHTISANSTNIGTDTAGTTNILGQVNIGNSGLPTGGGVNIATGTFGGSQSYVTIGSSTFPAVYMRSSATRINDVGGFVEIGNGTLGYTAIKSNGISIGQYLTGNGYIDIGGAANTTTGYMVLGSANLDANYIRSRNIYMNTESGHTNIGNFTGTANLYSYNTLITGAVGNSWNSACLCMISAKASIKGDALGIQSLQDNGQYLISFFNNVNIVRGMIRGINSTSVEYSTTSDRRLKKNIKTMDSMLENIMRMKPCSFGWISNEDTGYGFIAQEVYEIFPHLRHKHPSCLESCHDSPCDCSGNPVYYGLDYGQFTPYIVKAMQEMKTGYDAKLQEQSEQIAQLMARVAALETV